MGTGGGWEVQVVCYFLTWVVVKRVLIFWPVLNSVILFGAPFCLPACITILKGKRKKTDQDEGVCLRHQALYLQEILFNCLPLSSPEDGNRREGRAPGKGRSRQNLPLALSCPVGSLEGNRSDSFWWCSFAQVKLAFWSAPQYFCQARLFKKTFTRARQYIKYTEALGGCD